MRGKGKINTDVVKRQGRGAAKGVGKVYTAKQVGGLELYHTDVENRLELRCIPSSRPEPNHDFAAGRCD